MFYSAKRQQYLIDQGYTFKIVTNLCEKAAVEAVKQDYVFSTPEDDRRILRTVLTAETDLEKVNGVQCTIVNIFFLYLCTFAVF